MGFDSIKVGYGCFFRQYHFFIPIKSVASLIHFREKTLINLSNNSECAAAITHFLHLHLVFSNHIFNGFDKHSSSSFIFLCVTFPFQFFSGNENISHLRKGDKYALDRPDGTARLVDGKGSFLFNL